MSSGSPPTYQREGLKDDELRILKALPLYPTYEAGFRALGMSRSMWEKYMREMFIRHLVSSAHQMVHVGYKKGYVVPADGLDARRLIRPKLTPTQVRMVDIVASTSTTGGAARMLYISGTTLLAWLDDISVALKPVTGRKVTSRPGLVREMWEWGYFKHRPDE